jgi:hypothetical protein
MGMCGTAENSPVIFLMVCYFWRFVLQFSTVLLIFIGFGNFSGSVLQFLAATSENNLIFSRNSPYFWLIIFSNQIPLKIDNYHKK